MNLPLPGVGKSLRCLLTCNWCVVRVITVMCNRPLHYSGVSAAGFLATNCKQLQHFHLCPAPPRPSHPAQQYKQHNRATHFTSYQLFIVLYDCQQLSTNHQLHSCPWHMAIAGVGKLSKSNNLYSMEFVFNWFYFVIWLSCVGYLLMLIISTLPSRSKAIKACIMPNT